jgi:hypothetical protein
MFGGRGNKLISALLGSLTQERGLWVYIRAKRHKKGNSWLLSGGSRCWCLMFAAMNKGGLGEGRDWVLVNNICY